MSKKKKNRIRNIELTKMLLYKMFDGSLDRVDNIYFVKTTYNITTRKKNHQSTVCVCVIYREKKRERKRAMNKIFKKNWKQVKK